MISAKHFRNHFMHFKLCILQEGENNDKFDTHPGSQAALPAYLITHNTLFYMLDLVASIGLLSLALFEPPHVPRLYMHIAVSLNLVLHIIIITKSIKRILNGGKIYVC